MLVLTRKLQQQIRISENITVTVLRISGNTVRLGVDAPQDVQILRGELPHFREEEPSAPTAASSADRESDDNKEATDDEPLPLTPGGLTLAARVEQYVRHLTT